MSVKWYQITCQGCDDRTEVGMRLTDAEATLMRQLCELMEKTSTYGCQPEMQICEDTDELAAARVERYKRD